MNVFGCTPNNGIVDVARIKCHNDCRQSCFALGSPHVANDGDGKYSISIVSVAWKPFYTGDTGRQPGSRELSYASNHTADTGI
jgi:hypothetical protein